MKKAVIIILIALFSNNIFYFTKANIGSVSEYRTQREYQKSIRIKKKNTKETLVLNLFLGTILVTTFIGSSLKKVEDR